MSLLDRQRAFIAEISADDDLPPSGLGMAIYRNAYRARLADALAVSFERTRRWVGEDTFALACAHYIISSPPRSWTLDAFGDGFPETLAILFPNDPEVTELAWMEWHMQQAFAAPDRTELTPQALAQAALDEKDWESLCLRPAAGLAHRPVTHDLPGLWRSLGEAETHPLPLASIEPAILLIWRQDLSPRYRLVSHREFAAVAPLLDGCSFAETVNLVGGSDLAWFGQHFAGWLQEGLFSGFTCGQAISP